MKTKWVLLFLLALASLLLVACNVAGGEVAAPTAAPVVTESTAEPIVTESPATPVVTESPATPEDKISVDHCVEAGAGQHALIFAARGVCFLYPDHYDAVQAEDNSNVGLYVRSLLNTEAPMLSLTFEPANGRSVGDVVAERLVATTLPDTAIQDVTLGGQPAIRLDDVPGQDLSRQVIAVHNDMVYDLSIIRIGADYGAVNDQAEALYQMVTDTFQFIGIEPHAPLLAGPECPEAAAGTVLVTHADSGYCLLLPEAYTVDDTLVTDAGGQETAVYVGSPLDTTHARLFITVEDAGGRSLQEITDAKAQEIEAALGESPMWSFGLMLDGAFANQFDQVPGQDLSRQLVLVRDNRLYTLTFIPDEPAAGDRYAEMQALYELVMDSFSFLWQ